MRVHVVLCLLALLSIMIQPATAARFSIHVTDSGEPIKNALVKVWQESSLVENGRTNSDGFFVILLNDGETYRIEVDYLNKHAEKIYVANSAGGHQIEIP